MAGAAQEGSLGRGHGGERESAGRSSWGTAAAGLGLQAVLARSPCPKGRLLHYFPLPSSPNAAESTGRGSGAEAAVDASNERTGSSSGSDAFPASAQGAGVARAKQGGGGGQIDVRAECSAGASAGEQGRLGDGGAGAAAEEDWCGWHRDHGSLTGAACCGAYLNPE